MLGLALVVGCGQGEAAGPPGGPGGFGGPGGPMGGPAAIPAVEVVQSQLGTLPLEERLVGVVKADNQVAIFPEITSPIAEVPVQNGDFVRRGQVLVRLESRQFQEQLNQSRASLRIAEADAKQAEARLRELMLQFERTEALAAKDLVSALELETQRAQADAARASSERAIAQVDQARATVEERETNLARTEIRAPISGRVGQRNAEVGMRANPNVQLFTIGNLDKVRVEIALTEQMLTYIQEGQNVRISSEIWTDTAIVQPLSRISPFLEESSFSTTGEIDVANAGGLLKAGMFVNVDVFYGESQQATIVPNSALYEDPNSGVMGIYVASSLGLEMDVPLPETEDGQAPLTEPTPLQFKEVQIIAQGHDLAGVDGIDPNVWVVTLGQHLLRGERPQARVRATTWKRLIALQNLKREDLLEQFLEKQQRLAKPPSAATETSP
jgi:RND family efflux transporter MFP subunit